MSALDISITGLEPSANFTAAVNEEGAVSQVFFRLQDILVLSKKVSFRAILHSSTLSMNLAPESRIPSRNCGKCYWVVCCGDAGFNSAFVLVWPLMRVARYGNIAMT